MIQDPALLHVITANPEDDTPRLIYADWLEEHGEMARAEFIRLQCTLAQIGAGDSRRVMLAQREQQLLATHRDEWLAELPQFPGVTWESRFRQQVSFDRGFVNAVVFNDADAFAAHADQVFAATPVQDVYVIYLSLEAVQALAQSPFLSRLSTLTVAGAGIGDEGARAVADSPHATRLTVLRFPQNEIGDRGLAALAQSPHLPHLGTLDLAQNEIGDSGLRVLAGSRLLTHLVHLDLSVNRIGDGGVQGLATSSPRRLSFLNLGHNRITCVGAEVLAASDVMLHLSALGLYANHIGPRGAQGLANSVCPRGVGTLDLRDNPIGWRGRYYLQQRLGHRVQL